MACDYLAALLPVAICSKVSRRDFLFQQKEVVKVADTQTWALELVVYGETK